MQNKFLPELNGELRVKLTEYLRNDYKNKNNKPKCCRQNFWTKFTYAEIEENILEFQQLDKEQKAIKLFTDYKYGLRKSKGFKTKDLVDLFFKSNYNPPEKVLEQ